MTRSSGRAPARARLAELMDARRRDLRLTWDEVATRAGINRETLRQIRNGNGDIRPLSKTGIEDALEWERGSVDVTLAGGEPTVLAASSESPDERVPTLRELAEQMAVLRQEIEAMRAERHRQHDAETEQRHPNQRSG